MRRFIDAQRERFGVEPICRVLQVAPASYYAARRRPPSSRALDDRALSAEIVRIHAQHFGVYGVRKVWRQLGREQIVVGRDRVWRLMRSQGLAGAVRARRRRTTRPAPASRWPADLVARRFAAAAPNRLWVADLTYVALSTGGFAYVAFIIDAFARRIVGWRVAATLRTELALDALEMALWTRRGESLDGLIHHSDRGVQYLAVRYAARLAEAGALGSVGSVGDSYDNALAESVIGLYKAELVSRAGPWLTLEQLELASAGWIEWWNQRRLHSVCDDSPPAEFEAAYWIRQEQAIVVA